jgi:hypothetical protein
MGRMWLSRDGPGCGTATFASGVSFHMSSETPDMICLFYFQKKISFLQQNNGIKSHHPKPPFKKGRRLSYHLLGPNPLFLCADGTIYQATPLHQTPVIAAAAPLCPRKHCTRF